MRSDVRLESIADDTRRHSTNVNVGLAGPRGFQLRCRQQLTKVNTPALYYSAIAKKIRRFITAKLCDEPILSDIKIGLNVLLPVSKADKHSSFMHDSNSPISINFPLTRVGTSTYIGILHPITTSYIKKWF